MSDPDNIRTWRRLDRRITTSGQPREDQLPLLAALGIRHVVNLGLHTHPDALADEAGSLARLGLNYIHLPVAFDCPSESDYAGFREVMARIGDEAVHVHCIANLRVSAFLYRWQREVRGCGQAEARQLMDSVWRPGGVWAAFVGDGDSVALPHRAPATVEPCL